MQRDEIGTLAFLLLRGAAKRRSEYFKEGIEYEAGTTPKK
jgi:hypothetical protein